MCRKSRDGSLCTNFDFATLYFMGSSLYERTNNKAPFVIILCFTGDEKLGSAVREGKCSNDSVNLFLNKIISGIVMS